MHYVYILYSNTYKRFYKGSTEDLRKRLDCHNTGKVKSTAKYLPWILVYYEAFANKIDALIEERFLKTGKGRERIKYLLKNTIS